MKRLLLIRHAESQNNVAHAQLLARLGTGRALAEAEEYHRTADPVLSETGYIQAKYLAAALPTRLTGQKVMLLCSPMLRALLTADAIREALALPCQQVQCLQELYEVGGCHLGDDALPGMGRKQIESRFPIDARDIPLEGWFAAFEQRESKEQAQARCERVLARMEELLSDDEDGIDTYLVVAHGDLLTRLMRLFLRMSWRQTLTFVHGNTGITELFRYPDGDITLQGLNDLSHLPQEHRTGLGEGWRGYGQPDLSITRYQGRDRIPEHLRANCDHLRASLLEGEQKQLDDYLDSDQRAFHFIATVRGDLAGYVQYDPLTNRLRQMIVHADFRGGGIGRKLVSKVKEEAEHQGRECLLVHAWAESDPFYRRLGFRPEGDLRVEATTPWLPMALFI